MSIYEITSEIVKTAIENNKITFLNYAVTDEEAAERQNSFNAKQIADFYKAVFNGVDSTRD